MDKFISPMDCNKTLLLIIDMQDKILNNVRSNGDQALIQYTKEFKPQFYATENVPTARKMLPTIQNYTYCQCDFESR